MTSRSRLIHRLIFILPVALVSLMSTNPISAQPPSDTDAPAALGFTMQKLGGESVELAEEYEGKVVLFVNVASKCGYTRQYEGLQQLHADYASDGLAVVGVPCNQFGGQEPGTAEEIEAFCSDTYGVDFDLLEKVDVNGDDACPLYAYLTGESPFPGKIKWNFEKFLVSRSGEVVARYPSSAEPTGPEITADVQRELAQ